MTRMLTKIIVLVAVSMFVIACGGKQEKSLKQRTMDSVADDADPISAIIGEVGPGDYVVEADEQPADVPAAEQGTDEDYVGGADALFNAVVKVDGKDVKATYTVRTAEVNPVVVKENVPTGTDLTLPPGSYDFEFTTTAIAGEPTRELRDVELPAGRRTRRDVKFPTGKITLVTSGKGCAKSKIKIKQKGASDWMPGDFYTCKEIILLSGEYEALKGNTPIKGIQVYDGGIRNVPIINQ